VGQQVSPKYWCISTSLHAVTCCRHVNIISSHSNHDDDDDDNNNNNNNDTETSVIISIGDLDVTVLHRLYLRKEN